MLVGKCMLTDKKVMTLSPERQLERRNLCLAICIAGLIHAGAIVLFLGWTTVKEPEFPYIPLASLDFSTYDPGSGPSGGSIHSPLSHGMPKPRPDFPPAPKEPSKVLPKELLDTTAHNKLDVVASKAETDETVISTSSSPTKAKDKAPKAPASAKASSRQPEKTPPHPLPEKAAGSPPPSATTTANADMAGATTASPNGKNLEKKGYNGSGQDTEGAGRGAGQGNPDAEKAYLAHIVKKLNRYKKYPASIRAKRVSGTATIRFTLNASGEVATSHLVTGSGHPALDQEAMALVRRASPFKHFPKTIERTTMTLTVPIHFNTR